MVYVAVKADPASDGGKGMGIASPYGGWARRTSLNQTQARRIWKSGCALPGRGQWVWVRGGLVYCRRACLSVPWDDERRACRIESRRLRKVDLHTRLVAEYEAAISEVAEEQWFSAGVE